MIELKEITKKYGGFRAVDNLNLTVARGEIFGFLGPNGAGKTTTIKMIVGVLEPSAGTITIGGVDILKQPEAAKRKIGFIPDRPYLYEKLTGMEFLKFLAGHMLPTLSAAIGLQTNLDQSWKLARAIS